MTEVAVRKKRRAAVAPVYPWIALSLRDTVRTDGDLRDRGDQVFLACDKKKLYVKNYVKYERWNDVTEGRR